MIIAGKEFSAGELARAIAAHRQGADWSAVGAMLGCSAHAARSWCDLNYDGFHISEAYVEAGGMVRAATAGTFSPPTRDVWRPSRAADAVETSRVLDIHGLVGLARAPVWLSLPQFAEVMELPLGDCGAVLRRLMRHRLVTTRHASWRGRQVWRLTLDGFAEARMHDRDIPARPEGWAAECGDGPRVLDLLSRQDKPVSSAVLAKALGMSNPAVGAVLGRLRREGKVLALPTGRKAMVWGVAAAEANSQ